jgi:hypothetical protein
MLVAAMVFLSHPPREGNRKLAKKTTAITEAAIMSDEGCMDRDGTGDDLSEGIFRMPSPPPTGVAHDHMLGRPDSTNKI